MNFLMELSHFTYEVIVSPEYSRNLDSSFFNQLVKMKVSANVKHLSEMFRSNFLP